MDIPRFTPESINHRIASGDIGDAFQLFVYEVLQREYPRLHRFPAGGKDGGIDLVDLSNGNVAIECKFVGDDKYQSIESRWKAVRKHLEEHLKDANGPTLGQSQYRPWYSMADPIGEYCLSVSAAFGNEDQRRELKDSIAEFFQRLARQYPHLSHLQNLGVSVIDWSDLTAKLQKQPHLIFRWFPGSRPSGLVPLDDEIDVGTFRAYLTNAKLPYYSVAEHLKIMPTPAGTAILDEETLLACFDNPKITGLVITGKGGVGKSRLTLELGWIALRKGWTVMRVQSRLKEDTLEKFAEKLTPDTPALLLIDYIETQTNFGELVETINVLNDSGIANLRYVAACRTNYYHRAVAASERHLPVDLTPPPGSIALDWFTGYRRKTVERILSEGGLSSDEKYLAVCNNIPILAVFLAYLHTSGRTEDLTELLNEVEFGRWVAKRVQLTFQDRSVSRELALLIPLFPMPESNLKHFSETVYQQLFDSLATDGWVERVLHSESELPDTWVTAHDVLADQILVAFVRGIPSTAEIFVADLLSLAAKTECLSSAIVSLQRASDTPPFNAVKWLKVLSNAIAADGAAWYEIRGLLIRTTLLSASEQLTLLRSHQGIWAGAEHDSGFQKTLGWLARRVVKQGEEVSEEDRDTLVQWITRAAPLAEHSNFIITWGLRIAPEALKDTAFSWIATKPTLLQTHYLMVAWLDEGFGPDAILPYVQQWIQKFSRNYHLSFLVQAWLDAGGDKELVRGALSHWLAEHGRAIEARFVYKAWLDAGGDKELVRGALSDWLADHGRAIEARFVHKAWLDAGGDKELVRGALSDWLADHGRAIEAQFVYKAWLNAGGDPELVRGAVSDWLADHGRAAEAPFVYRPWLEAGGDKELVRGALNDWLADYGRAIEARFVYKAWLDAGGDKELVRGALSDWLADHGRAIEAQFVYQAWLDAGGDPELVRRALSDWLADHGRRLEANFVYKAWLDAGRDSAFVQEAVKNWLIEHGRNREADFVFVAWLDAGGDLALLQDAIKQWLVEHGKSLEATHIYKAWFNAGGDLQVIWDPVIAWLARHKTEESAVYVTTFIAKQRDLTVETIRDILTWCRTFPANENALWRLTQLRKHVLRSEVAEEFIFTSEIVLAHLFVSPIRPTNTTKEQISLVFFNLFTSTEMQSGPLRERVDILFVKWIKHPHSFGPGATPFWRVQSTEFLKRVFALLDIGYLAIPADTDALRRLMLWLNAWDVDAKLRLLPILSRLASKYPVPELWDLVKLDQD